MIPPGTDTSPDADPDCDHLTNWFEYALGSDPFRYSTPVAAEIDPNDPASLLVRYPQRSDHAERGIVYIVETSHDLANWSIATGAEKLGELSQGVEQWQLTVPVDGEKTFARLRANGIAE